MFVQRVLVSLIGEVQRCHWTGDESLLVKARHLKIKCFPPNSNLTITATNFVFLAIWPFFFLSPLHSLCLMGISGLFCSMFHFSIKKASVPLLLVLHYWILRSSWPNGSILFFLSSTSAKIRAIEAKLQMMEQNPDDTSFSGPPAYMYNKPPEKKRWEPYSKSHHSHQGRPFRRFRRWPVLSQIMESSLPPQSVLLSLLIDCHDSRPHTSSLWKTLAAEQNRDGGTDQLNEGPTLDCS